MTTAEQFYIYQQEQPDAVFVRGNQKRYGNIMTVVKDQRAYKAEYIAKYGQDSWDRNVLISEGKKTTHD